MKKLNSIVLGALLLQVYTNGFTKDFSEYTFESGHPSLQEWLLPSIPPVPEDNALTSERIELGKKLFFDPRLSGDGNMSCATCHNPLLGWSDGLPTAKGFKSMVLGRATPTVINTAFNSLQMWDGRKKSLEDQATGPMEASVEMHADLNQLIDFLNSNSVYVKDFDAAYPGEIIDKTTISKAIASFERTVISNSSPFDAWVKGDETAMTEQQVEGFRLFVNPDKGNCAVCHSAPNFTDNGFHNLGLASHGNLEPDMGRYAQKPLPSMKGAFKAPTLRDITLTAPYFHDGSAKTLADVVEHYNKGGIVKTDLSPNIKTLNLTADEKAAIAAFLNALTSPVQPMMLPVLPVH